MVNEEKALVTKEAFTREQIELIKHTVAVGATDNELKLFLYQAQKRGLDPLSRQIHFIKRKRYNTDTEAYEEVGTIQTGIDGFRVVADRTGKLSGIKRGLITTTNGELIGAWAEVYRSDWQHPAREEVSFKEYCQRKKDGSPMGLWKTMPETMIKKVAEAAALRMAFPEDLSGIYSHEEMQVADNETAVATISEPQKPTLASQPERKGKTLTVKAQFWAELKRITGKGDTELTLADVDAWLEAHGYMGLDDNKPIWGQITEEAQKEALEKAKAE